jgi:Fe-S-cluster containining protein
MPDSIKRGLGVVRRFYLVHCRKHYVRQQLLNRSGECMRCGKCCSIIVRCPFLKDGNHCSIYSARPAQCRAFPIDWHDLSDVPQCSFRFNGAARPVAGSTQADRTEEPRLNERAV